MLINSHRSVDLPRPSMPGLIDVGGAHIQKAKPLPDHIKVRETFCRTNQNHYDDKPSLISALYQ